MTLGADLLVVVAPLGHRSWLVRCIEIATSRH